MQCASACSLLFSSSVRAEPVAEISSVPRAEIADEGVQELRLQSVDREHFSWIVGGYFLRDRVNDELAINRFSGGGVTPATQVVPDGRSLTSAYAAFADGTVALTDPVELSLFGKNLTNVRYLNNIAALTSVTAPAALPLFPQGMSLGHPAEGRSVNVEATVRF